MVGSRSIFWRCSFIDVFIPVLLCEHLRLSVVGILLSCPLDVLLLVPVHHLLLHVGLFHHHHAKSSVLSKVLWAVGVSSVVRVVDILPLAIAPAVFAVDVLIFASGRCTRPMRGCAGSVGECSGSVAECAWSVGGCTGSEGAAPLWEAFPLCKATASTEGRPLLCVEARSEGCQLSSFLFSFDAC